MPLLIEVPDKPAVWPPPVDRESWRSRLEYARRRDPWGHLTHSILAAVYLFLLPLTTAPKDGAFIMLLVYSLMRLHCTLPALACLLRDRLVQLLLALAAWHAVGLAWSDSRMVGLEELRAFRVVITPFLIWPVIDRIGWMLTAFLLGVASQNAVQLFQHLRWFDLRPARGRLDGLLHAIQVGTVCSSAILWHLAATLRGKWWLRLVSLAGLLAATAGLVYSGSRGPWIASAISVGLFIAYAAFRHARLRIPLVIATVLGIAAVTATVYNVDLVEKRWDAAMADLDAARHGELDTNLGHRLALWSDAWAAFCAAPIVGHGPGGFENWVRTDMDQVTDGHAHSMYLHILATTGAIGGGLLLVAMFLLLLRAFRDPEDTPWSLATPMVVVSWLLAAQFDAYQLDGHTFGLLAFLATITIPGRPVKGVER